MQRRTRTTSARPGGRLTAIIAALAVPGTAAHAAAPEAAPREAVDFALKGLDGRNLRLSEYRGDPVVLTFWASWCGPCRESLVALDELGARAAVPVLGVNIDGPGERAASVAGSLHLRFPTLLDARQEVARVYDVERLPLTLLIDRDGKVRASWSGASVDPDELSRRFTALQQE